MTRDDCPECGVQRSLSDQELRDLRPQSPADWAGAKVIKIGSSYLLWDCVAEVYQSEDGTSFSVPGVLDLLGEREVEVIAR